MPQNYKNLFKLLQKGEVSRAVLFVLLFFTLLEASSAIVHPLITKDLVNQLSSEALPWSTIALLAAVLVGGSLISSVSLYMTGKLGEKFVNDTRRRIHQHILRLPVKVIESGQAAEPANRLISDTAVIGDFISQQVVSLLSGLIILIASLSILFVIDAVLAGVLFGCVIVAFLFILPIAGKITHISKSVQDQEATVIGRLAEVFSHFKLVKTSTSEQQESAMMQKEFDQLYNWSMKEVSILAIMTPVAGISISFSLVTILAVGAGRVADGSITLGDLIAFILYLFNVVMPLTQLSLFTASLNKAAGAAVRLSELESAKQENYSGNTVNAANQDIRCRQLQFHYDASETNIVKRDKDKNHNELTLKIDELDFKANQLTALVGSSGSGKSTLIHLVNRLYEVDGLLIGNSPLKSVDLNHWRNQLASVAQNSPVLAGTVRFNLTYGLAKNVTDAQCEQALQRAQLWTFLTQKDGLDTQIGEQGVNLSGGQKQRLAIARAILREPAILLLDEATSALDTKTELAITQAIEELTHNRTCIVAAHRLSTVKNADLIVVLDQGRVVATGTHEELLVNCTFYKQLVQEQLMDKG